MIKVVFTRDAMVEDVVYKKGDVASIKPEHYNDVCMVEYAKPSKEVKTPEATVEDEDKAKKSTPKSK